MEASIKDFMVTPSQGSHFFQNLTSFMVAYFTTNSYKEEGFVDWDWLKKQKTVQSLNYTNHIHLNKSIKIKMNGHENIGIILKPEH